MMQLSSFNPIGVVTIIGIFYFCDIMSTYFFLKIFKKEFPEYKDWADAEINPIVNYCLKKFGIKKGILISMAITSPVILFMMIISKTYDFFFGLVMGMYFFTIRIHIESWRRMYKSIRKRDEKLTQQKTEKETELKIGEKS